MLRYRLFAALAAGLIALAGVLAVTAGGTPTIPPPVALRGATPDTHPVGTDGLEFVPPTVAEMVPAGPDTTSGGSPEPTSPPADSVASADVASADSPDAADSPDEADSPDTDETTDVIRQQADSRDLASADSPDDPEPASADSPDSPDSPDSADSPDD